MLPNGREDLGQAPSATVTTDKMTVDSYAVEVEKSAGNSATNTGGQPAESHAVFRCFSVRTVDVIAKFLAELIGTAMLLFIGCGSGLSWTTPRGDYIGAIGFGLTVMLIIQCFGTVSGAHLNPAVTLCALLYRTISWQLAIVYTFAQIIGSFVGYGLLVVLTPPHIFRPDPLSTAAAHCMTVPHAGLSAVQAVMLEFLATLVLIVLCCASWDPRNAKHQDSVALKFGLSVAVLSISVGPATGCGMNPARTLGPAIWNNDWTMHWIYWVGPLSAAVFTTLLYQSIFAVPTTKSTPESDRSAEHSS